MTLSLLDLTPTHDGGGPVVLRVSKQTVVLVHDNGLWTRYLLNNMRPDVLKPMSEARFILHRAPEVVRLLASAALVLLSPCEIHPEDAEVVRRAKRTLASMARSEVNLQGLKRYISVLLKRRHPGRINPFRGAVSLPCDDDALRS